jgi:hypothetical protein
VGLCSFLWWLGCVCVFVCGVCVFVWWWLVCVCFGVCVCVGVCTLGGDKGVKVDEHGVAETLWCACVLCRDAMCL